MDCTKFRVIIVGSGPVGLYLAHAMERASINYVVLEQHSTVLNLSGQLLFTWPHTVRLLDQLGLYEDAKEFAIPLHYKKRIYGHDGHVTSTNRFWDYVRPNHGYPFLTMPRSDLIKVLYTNLKSRETNITTGAEVIDIETYAEGVRVRLANGNTVDGSIVIGADGVHSKTRGIMHKLAGDSSSEDMISSFYGIFGWADISDLPIEPEVFFESRGAGAVIQCLGTRERLRFVALKPLPEAVNGLKRYTAGEMEEYAESIANVAVCPGFIFRDVWERADKGRARMLNQEEGFMSRWHHHRIVLVGDAVHKSTSVNGLGMTCGLHSAAVLASLLQSLFVASDHSPSLDEIKQVFSRYEKERQEEVKPVWDGGYSMIRQVTRDSWWSWMWDRYVLPVQAPTLWLCEEGGIADTCRELDILLIGYNPLDRGWLTGQLKTLDELSKNDFRYFYPRFQPGHFDKNVKLAEVVAQVAMKKECTSAQVAIAWVQQQGGLPIPGSSKVSRVLENTERIKLTETETAEMHKALQQTEVFGDRYPEMFYPYLDL